MTNAEKRDLRVWAFEAVSKRNRQYASSEGGTICYSHEIPLLEQIGEADALAEWVASGEVKL